MFYNGIYGGDKMNESNAYLYLEKIIQKVKIIDAKFEEYEHNSFISAKVKKEGIITDCKVLSQKKSETFNKIIIKDEIISVDDFYNIVYEPGEKLREAEYLAIREAFDKDFSTKITDFILMKRLEEKIIVTFNEVIKKNGYYSMNLAITLGRETKNIAFVKKRGSFKISNAFDKNSLTVMTWLSNKTKELTTEKEKEQLYSEDRKCSYKHSEKLFADIIVLKFKETKSFKMSSLYGNEELEDFFD
jgi:hypothetical protein